MRRILAIWVGKLVFGDKLRLEKQKGIENRVFEIRLAESVSN